MLFSDIVPFIRFAETIHFASAGKPVYVKDCRILYILSGEGELQIGGQTHPLLPQTVFYCCSGNVYTISSAGMELISVNFDLTQARRHRELPYSPVPITDRVQPAAEYTESIEDQPVLSGYLLLPEGLACRQLLEGIMDEFSTRRILYREAAGAFMKRLLTQLLRHNAEYASQGAQAAEKIIDYISVYYYQPLTNQHFSRLTGYHEYYLNRLFTKHTGSTIHHYILNVRINHAKRLLLTTDLPLSTIAEQVGFNSNTYFSSYFRQSTGLSPTQFRKKRKSAV